MVRNRSVKIDSQAGADLTIMMGLLSPDQIAALDYANQQLKNRGLLPVDYQMVLTNMVLSSLL